MLANRAIIMLPRLLLASLAISATASEAPLDVVSDCFGVALDVTETLFARPGQMRCILAVQEACASDPYVIGYDGALGDVLCQYHLVEWLAGNFTHTNLWFTDVLPILTGLAQQQGLAWPAEIFTQDNSICTNSFEQNTAFAFQWSSYILSWSHQLQTGVWGSSDFAVWDLHETFRRHHIDGPTMCRMSADDLVSLGVPFGAAKAFVHGMQDYLYAQVESAPGASTYDPADGQYHATYPGRPANVSITIVLEHLYNINEIAYTFNVGFLLVMSWEDDRISTRCEGAGGDGVETPSSDLCAHYWQPQMKFANVLQYEEGEYEVITDYGLFTEVGMASLRAVETDKNLYLPHSIAYSMKRIKGTFTTPMGFKFFPFDCQTLLLKATAVTDDATIYRFVPMATIGPSLTALLRATDGEANVVSGWNVTSIHAREYLLSERPAVDEFIDTSIQYETYASMDQVTFQHGPGIPIFDAIMRLRNQIPVVEGKESESYQRDELFVPGMKPYSEAYFAIQVQREPHSFVFNFSMLVALLIFIAFASFLFPDKDMNGRITLALTVFLGVIFFQMTVVDSLPRTGSFTTMHVFMFLSSIFNGIIVLEHALVYALHAWVGKQAAIIQRVNRLRRNRTAVRHAVRLQRAFRRHRIHKLHMEAISPEPDPKTEASNRNTPRGSCSLTPRSTTAPTTAPAATRLGNRASSEPPVSEVHVEFAPESPRDQRIELTASRASDRDASQGIEVTGTMVQNAEPTSPSSKLRLRRSITDLGSTTKSHYTHQLEARMKVADALAKGTPLKLKIYRKVFNWSVVFLDNSNRFFVITTSLAYFVLVYYYVFLRVGQQELDAKCSDPWTTASLDPRIQL